MTSSSSSSSQIPCSQHSISTVDSPISNTTVEFPQPSNPIKLLKKKKMIRKKSMKPSASGGYVSNSGSSATSQSKVLRKRRFNVGGGGGVDRQERELGALGLPLGMSIAVVVAQVIDKKSAADENISADDLSLICASAVKESLANVFGDRFSCFTENFEKSFGSTLRTLRLVNGASLDLHKKDDYVHHTYIKKPEVSLRNFRDEETLSTDEDIQGSLWTDPLNGKHTLSLINGESLDVVKKDDYLPHTYIKKAEAAPRKDEKTLSNDENKQESLRMDSLNGEQTLHEQMNQQLTCSSISTLDVVSSSSSMSILEKYVMEQARSNDLKTFEIGLIMKQIELKKSKIDIDSESNLLQRCKLNLGFSMAAFKKEKFKTQLEEVKHVELLNKCIDFLVTGLISMPVCLAYGAYIYSYQRIMDFTSSCTMTTKEPKAWWMPKPVSSFSDGWSKLWCHVHVWSRIFTVLLLLGVVSLLLVRSGVTPKKMMPVTSVLIILGGFCSIAGKFCVQTLGGNGYIWLLLWGTMCLIHFFANVCTSALFYILHGPVSISGGITVKRPLLRYWIRRVVFYAILVFLPLLCGLMPFAGPSEWGSHFSDLGSHFFSRSRE